MPSFVYRLVTLGETIWLLAGASMGALGACAIPLAGQAVARLFRKPETPPEPSRSSHTFHRNAPIVSSNVRKTEA